MMEVSYVLESKPAGYGWDRTDIADALEAILEDPTLAVLDAPATSTACEKQGSRSSRWRRQTSRTIAMVPTTTINACRAVGGSLRP